MKLFTRSLLICFSLIFAVLAGAKDTVSIAGRVTDDKGVAIPGAGVRVSRDGQGPSLETLTDLNGAFQFQALPEGAYKLTVEIAGFIKAALDAVDAGSESSRMLEIRLQPLPRPQPPAAAKRPATKQQTEPAEALNFQTAEITDLPGLNQFQQDLAPTGDAGAAPRQDSLLLISGNAASLDAGNMNDPGFRMQMMDAARQMGFQLQEFGPGGEGGAFGMGGPAGAGATGGGGGPMGGGPPGGGGGFGFGGMAGRGGRAGSFKQPVIEGNLSETYGNSALNARNYSLTGKLLPKPVRIQNDFSLTVGGVFPFLKAKTASQSPMGPGFGTGPRAASQPGWSFSYSGSRNRNAQDILTTVPTDLERAGDFSQTYVQALVVDPATGKQTMVNRQAELYYNPNDPASRFTTIASIDPIAEQLLQFIPKANIPCPANAPCVNNYALQRSLPTTSDQFQVSVTGLRLGSRDNLAVNYAMRRGSSLSAATFTGLDTTLGNSAQNIGLSGTHRFQQRMFANWRVTLNRTRVESANAFAYVWDVEGELGITGVSRDPINWGPPTVQFTNYGSLSLAAPSFNRNQDFTVSGGLSRIGSKHSLQAGADVRWNQRNTRSDSNGRGTFSFTGYATVLLDSAGNQVAGTGHDFADFLLGLPYSTSRRFVDPAVNPYGNSLYLRSRSWNLFVMDNWRAKSTLTFNYGVRYEYTGPAFEKYDRLVSLDVAPGFASVAQVFPDSLGPISGRYFPRSLIKADRNNLAPRVGVAWRPSTRSRFVIRAGYGIGYNAARVSSLAGQLANQAPFAVTQNLASDRADPLTLRVGFPNDPAVTIMNTYAADPGYRPAYAQQWSLDIQTQISRLYVLTAGYTGSKGTGLDVLRAPAGVSNAGWFIYQTNGGSSIYHALNLQFSRRFSQGFNVTSSYTFSKSIDDASANAIAQNDADLRAERSLSDQDQRHSFRLNFMYDLPIGKNRMFFSGASNRLLNIISGWTFNGSYALASGQPLTARYASSGGGSSGAALYNSLRADATGLPVELPRDQRTVQRFFNTAAFAIPAGLYGNAGRNTITGPGQNIMNLSVRKSFNLDENNRRLDFSWQVQNLLNHPSWSGLSTTVNALNFGQVTGVRPMRSMTVNVRVRF